jgi:SpoVK/Ycf46/Vps4 family AAA+-type ATPase
LVLADTEQQANQFIEAVCRLNTEVRSEILLEDLDALLTDENRSFFLNELDGFATNDGVVLLATTNHPERLDPAILDRPGRFDRKYHFNLPALAERTQYMKLWNASLQNNMRLSEQAQEKKDFRVYTDIR